MDTPQTKSEKVQLVALIAALTWGKARDEKDKLTLRLAEHPDPDNQNLTVWHKAVATRTLAEKLKALDPPLKVGEKLEVDTGYPYQWKYTDKNGVERVNEGINLWVVKVRGETFRQTRKPKAEQAKKHKAGKAKS